MDHLQRLAQLRERIASGTSTREEQLAYLRLLVQVGAIEPDFIEEWKWLSSKPKLARNRERTLRLMATLGQLIEWQHERAAASVMVR